MKESTLLEMQNKIKAITNVLQQLINENTQLRDLAVGTLETIKHMPCLLYTSPSPRDGLLSRMPSSA